MHKFLLLIFLGALAGIANSLNKPCSVKETKSGFVCVCNSTYCDTIKPPSKLKDKQFHVYFTSSSSPGFNHHLGYFRNVQEHPPTGYRVQVDDTKKRQSIIGVGGAFTDSFGFSFNNLTRDTQDHLLKSYFSEDGIEYTFNRVVFGSSDFSLNAYSYVEDNDTSLHTFNLTESDFLYKIGPIQRANSLSKRELKLMGSAWSAPKWMKRQGNKMNQYLNPEHRQTWANYLVKIFEAFRNNSIELWGLTPNNEPITLVGFKDIDIENMVMMPEEQREWIANNLGPALEKNGFVNKSIVVLDDMRHYAQWWMDIVMRNETAAKYVDGVGMHWYVDFFASPKIMDKIKEKYPDKNIYYTESSINAIMDMLLTIDEGNSTSNFSSLNPSPPLLGSWKRAQMYATSLIENLNHWVNGYMDWNLALNEGGGPNLINMTCDAPIIINTTANEFYKQPMYYVLGHFSKFLKPDAVILDCGLDTFDGRVHDEEELNEYSRIDYEGKAYHLFLYYKDVRYIVALNPDGSHTVIVFNPKKTPQRFWIQNA
nr:glucocerebrosidase 3 [Nilaparvata lugens]